MPRQLISHMGIKTTRLPGGEGQATHSLLKALPALKSEIRRLEALDDLTWLEDRGQVLRLEEPADLGLNISSAPEPGDFG